tara:strand:- start:164 stop:514 length:351 start_codon:yes stop_codon:yes gene_type:complete
MTTTFKFAKTKIGDIRNELTQDDDATAWLDICNGFARIRVDNTLTHTNSAEFDSQKQKAAVKEIYFLRQRAFEIPRKFLCDLADHDAPLRIKAYYNAEKRIYPKILIRGLYTYDKG